MHLKRMLGMSIHSECLDGVDFGSEKKMHMTFREQYFHILHFCYNLNDGNGVLVE